MQVLHPADYKRMPWKNGKGETVEIAVFPPNATVEDFDWRISTATVVSDGPFSTFDDIDRTLTVLTGEGIELTVGGSTPIICYPDSDPYTFPADVTTIARLVDAPISDLNVMSRRGRCGHRVLRRTFDRELEVGSDTAETLVIIASSCQLKSTGEALEYLDAIRLKAGEKIDLRASKTASVFTIELMLSRPSSN
ncbi:MULTISPECIES: HutD family protein [unclassified Ensifer]|uniref:HutD/Ves family protein n=1 Tax=unclassified Ensifer TaxID=2633371 RepID=UPI0017817B19|nr:MULTISPECIES: HutD family protein [unclassified Ensifer]MBD9497872.1 HutD family protein [Ensifer sp. ENS01]MBD9561118.1 HutD family protein [Ensifer sp. ENS03]